MPDLTPGARTSDTYQKSGGWPKQEVARLVTGPTDQQYADELKRRMEASLEDALAIITEAAERGFSIQFHVGTNPLGRAGITMLRVSKEF